MKRKPRKAKVIHVKTMPESVRDWFVEHLREAGHFIVCRWEGSATIPTLPKRAEKKARRTRK